MSPSIHGEMIVETLLNTLEAERYVRGPLLATIIDELSVAEGLEMAAGMARAVLDGLESGQLSESEFGARVCALRQLVHTLEAEPVSGEVLVTRARVQRVQEEVARAVPRLTPAATRAARATEVSAA